jgi:hypothetical protein
MSATRSFKLSASTIEALVCMTYMSEPHIAVNCHSLDPNVVKLKGDARRMLEEEGAGFHKYGSQFVLG